MSSDNNKQWWVPTAKDRQRAAKLKKKCTAVVRATTSLDCTGEPSGIAVPSKPAEGKPVNKPPAAPQQSIWMRGTQKLISGLKESHVTTKHDQQEDCHQKPVEPACPVNGMGRMGTDLVSDVKAPRDKLEDQCQSTSSTSDLPEHTSLASLCDAHIPTAKCEVPHVACEKKETCAMTEKKEPCATEKKEACVMIDPVISCSDDPPSSGSREATTALPTHSKPSLPGTTLDSTINTKREVIPTQDPTEDGKPVKDDGQKQIDRKTDPSSVIQTDPENKPEKIKENTVEKSGSKPAPPTQITASTPRSRGGRATKTPSNAPTQPHLRRRNPHMQQQQRSRPPRRSSGQRSRRITGAGKRATTGHFASRDEFIASNYKTELCRSFLSTGSCVYEGSCQFAHGTGELRSRNFGVKYKTERCQNYHQDGYCRFGTRCKFIHDEQRMQVNPKEFWLWSPSENLVRVEIVESSARLNQLKTVNSNEAALGKKGQKAGLASRRPICPPPRRHPKSAPCLTHSIPLPLVRPQLIPMLARHPVPTGRGRGNGRVTPPNTGRSIGSNMAANMGNMGNMAVSPGVPPMSPMMHPYYPMMHQPAAPYYDGTMLYGPGYIPTRSSTHSAAHALARSAPHSNPHSTAISNTVSNTHSAPRSDAHSTPHMKPGMTTTPHV